MADKQLSARYQSPTSSQSFSSKVPSLLKDHDVKAKTEYLSALRAGIVQMQGDLNAFLTQKMEEEKSSDVVKASNKAREEKAEEMYGEEDPEAEG
jgi:phosphoribosylanthranilate isomerase